MKSPRDDLLDYLRRSEATPAAKAMKLKRTFQEFVLEYGWFFEPTELEATLPVGEPQQCHKNAADLTLADEGLIYCEGFALLKSGGQPTLHSWVTNGRGFAIDNTWQPPGVAYAGVPFKPSFVSMTALKNRATVSLLDDYSNNYPLRGELGDHPEVWLHPLGRGTERVWTQPSDNESDS